MGVLMQYVRIPVTAAVTRETHSLRKGLNKHKHKYKHLIIRFITTSKTHARDLTVTRLK